MIGVFVRVWELIKTRSGNNRRIEELSNLLENEIERRRKLNCDRIRLKLQNDELLAKNKELVEDNNFLVERVRMIESLHESEQRRARRLKKKLSQSEELLSDLRSL